MIKSDTIKVGGEAMKEALLYEKINNMMVICHVCEHHCKIKHNRVGLCGVRKNIGGTLYAINYPLTVASSIDPIEKKPIYHYLPHTRTYSFATEGCNLDCSWCQNHDIAASPIKTGKIRGIEVTPSEHIKKALDYDCPSISYTYTEPTIFLEYALETMKLAHQKGLKNIWVSNGFMSKETLELIIPYLDAINVDYKVHNDEAYKKYTNGKGSIVLRNMKYLKEANVHLEVTCLIVPGVNDEKEALVKMLQDLYDYLGEDQVIHLSRFFGAYKMQDHLPTPKETMYLARELALELGFKHIHLGNM